MKQSTIFLLWTLACVLSATAAAWFEGQQLKESTRTMIDGHHAQQIIHGVHARMDTCEANCESLRRTIDQLAWCAGEVFGVEPEEVLGTNNWARDLGADDEDVADFVVFCWRGDAGFPPRR